MTSPTDPNRCAVLVVEDDENLRITLTDNLAEEGYDVEPVATCAAALSAAAAQPFAVIVLDIMLPDGDGYTVCTKLRRSGCTAGILMLTARTLEDDVVRGFEAGADDYLSKPYRLRELLARVSALARRKLPGAGKPAHVSSVAGLEIDRKARTVNRAGVGHVELTRTEFDLLVCLVEHCGEALAREVILDHVWGKGVAVEQRTVDNFISSLKRKLGWQQGCGFNIRAIRGVGYRFDVESA